MMPQPLLAALFVLGFALGFLLVVLWKENKRLRANRRSQPAPAKPRVRVLPGGWIRHVPGPCPVPGRTIINTADSFDVHTRPRYASEVPPEWWEHRASSFGRDILLYRIVREAQP